MDIHICIIILETYLLHFVQGARVCSQRLSTGRRLKQIYESISLSL